MKKLWIVFQNTIGTWDFRKQEYLSVDYEFQGLFESKEMAIESCKNENYWIAPCVVNEKIPDEPLDWEGAYHPLSKMEEAVDFQKKSRGLE